MLIWSIVEIPLATKDPHEAVPKIVQMLRSMSDRVTIGELRIDLASGSDYGVLRRLAEAVPDATLGFKFGSYNKTLSKQEFLFRLATGSKALATFDGDLLPIMSFPEALILIEQLLKERPRAIRSTSFGVEARTIRWPGAPDRAHVNLDLSDMKAFPGKKRFSLSARLECGASGKKDAAVKILMDAASHATGIPFTGAKSYEMRDTKAADAPPAEQMLIIDACFRDAFDKTAKELSSKNIVLGILPGLSTHEDATVRRMDERFGGKREAVNFVQVVKGVFKAELPDYAFKSSHSDQMWFVKRLGEELNTAIIFEREHFFGIGKLFRLNLGLIGTGGNLAEFHWEKGLLRVFGRLNSELAWAYCTRAQLETALDGIVGLLQQILPSFEAACLRNVATIPKVLPPDIERRGAMTAREGLVAAMSHATIWAEDAVLRSVTSRGYLAVRAQVGACVGTDGRLKPHGYWSYTFTSAGKREWFDIEIPAIGPAEHLSSAATDQSLRLRLPLPDVWIDSDVALSLAEEHGGAQARATARSIGEIGCELTASRLTGYKPQWKIWYMLMNERGDREDFRIGFRATDGSDCRQWP